jgi:hypothetical protein
MRRGFSLGFELGLSSANIGAGGGGGGAVLKTSSGNNVLTSSGHTITIGS